MNQYEDAGAPWSVLGLWTKLISSRSGSDAVSTHVVAHKFDEEANLNDVRLSKLL